MSNWPTYGPLFGDLPPHMHDGLRLYVEQGVPPGGFLERVLCNDLVGAFSKADEDNTRAMKEWASWLYCAAPSMCWGSQERVTAWINRNGLEGPPSAATTTTGES